MADKTDEQLASELRAAHETVRQTSKALETRGYKVSRRGKQVHIAKTETKTTEL
jgi:DNA-binding transcriptional regulator YhcF (GntR family)